MRVKIYLEHGALNAVFFIDLNKKALDVSVIYFYFTWTAACTSVALFHHDYGSSAGTDNRPNAESGS